MNIQDVIRIAEFARSNAPDPRPPWLEKMRDTDHAQAMYYRFLYELAKAMQPKWVLETGTRFGLSAVQLAMGCPTSKVITLDIDPQSKARFSSDPVLKGIPNIIPLTADSRKAKELLPADCQSIDLLYLDSDHSYDVVMPEFKIFSQMVPVGGVVVFDDITLNPEMRRFWAEVPGPKAELTFLHRLSGAGFGAYIKT